MLIKDYDMYIGVNKITRFQMKFAKDEEINVELKVSTDLYKNLKDFKWPEYMYANFKKSEFIKIMSCFTLKHYTFVDIAEWINNRFSKDADQEVKSGNK
jgi:hypothetical protein